MTNNEKYNFLLNNIKGVGEVKAKKIVDSINDIEDILDLEKSKNADKLPSEIGKQLFSSLIEQLNEIKKQNQTIQTMVRCGISYSMSVEIINSDTLFSAFMENPYKTGYQLKINFLACDKFAHMMLARDDSSPDMFKSRMKYFINAMLVELENSGHTFAYLFQLVKQLNKYQRKNEYLPDNYTEAVVILYLQDNELITIEKSKKIKNWKICRKVTADLENDIAYHIKRLSKNNNLGRVPAFESNGLKFDIIQLRAIESAKQSGLKIITGPPGSGKTAVVNGIITYFKQINPNARISLCAPTGRAAKHMVEITGKNASTIHKLLGIGNVNFTKREMLNCDMLICDEASMLNLDIAYELLSRIKTGSVVYFVGDKNQLPAVGPGNVLHDIINSKVVPVYHLTKVYRQDGVILENAHKINSGVVPEKLDNQYSVSTFDNEADLKKSAIDWFKNNYDKNEPFETQILIPSYKSECGITAINNEIQKLNNNDFAYIDEKRKYKKYDKILMTKNNKDGLYQNGSVGIFLANMGDSISVEFEGEEIDIPKSAIDDMSLGYAMSVHKAQGSEYKNVLLCLPQKPIKMLKRNIIYTAVTRAKNTIAIYEMNGSMKKSIETSDELFVQTNLKEKLLLP